MQRLVVDAPEPDVKIERAADDVLRVYVQARDGAAVAGELLQTRALEVPDLGKERAFHSSHWSLVGEESQWSALLESFCRPSPR